MSIAAAIAVLSLSILILAYTTKNYSCLEGRQETDSDSIKSGSDR